MRPVATKRRKNTPSVEARAPPSGISMRHRQGKTAGYLADDSTSIVECAPEGMRADTSPASHATRSGETARECACELVVIIGANGAGKTKWVRAHRSWLPRPFYNVDVIADGLVDADDPELQREARALTTSGTAGSRVQRPSGIASRPSTAAARRTGKCEMETATGSCAGNVPHSPTAPAGTQASTPEDRGARKPNL